MVQARYDAAMAKVEHMEKLTRTEQAAKQTENARQREAALDRLKQEMQKQTGAILPWLNIERLYLEVILGRELDRAAEDCWEFVGAKPKPAPAEEDPASILDNALLNRYLVTLMNLAGAKTPSPRSPTGC